MKMETNTIQIGREMTNAQSKLENPHVFVEKVAPHK